MLREGASYSEIADAVGCAKATISYHAKRIGLARNFRPEYDWQEIQRYHSAGHSIAECRRKFGFAKDTWTYAVNQGNVIPQIEEAALEDLKSRSSVRRRILRDDLIPYECQLCTLSEWLGTPLSLELDHINGISNDHRLENLRFLCPNCHSQTLTWGSRGKRAA